MLVLLLNKKKLSNKFLSNISVINLTEVVLKIR